MRRYLLAFTLLLVIALAGTAQALPRLHASGGKHPAVRDQRGRQVTLRGVNVTALQDSYQVNPSLAPSAPLTTTDLTQMRALGFNVIRLAVSWSALEPTRGHLNQAYLDRIKRTVARAARYGIYTVIDMHNDGWSKFISSRGRICPEGTLPVQGFDGAPRWASLSGEASRCLSPQARLSPAVLAAWDSFWQNKNAIRSALSRTWGKLAQALAHESAVAGYDLLNAPLTRNQAQLKALGHFYDQSIESIRRGERKAHGFSHMAFFNPNITWGSNPPLSRHSPAPGFTEDRNIVFSAQIYGGANGGGQNPLSQTRQLLRRQTKRIKARAKQYGAPAWIAEWGFSRGTVSALSKIQLQARVQDRLQWGSSWWQWKVSCGNPILFSGPDDLSPHPFAGNLNPVRCPNGLPMPSPSGWKEVLGRPYPMASPGRLKRFKSEPARKLLTVAGKRRRHGSKTLVAWVPSSRVKVRGALGRPKLRRVAGGTVVRARVRRHYRVTFKGR